MGPYLLTGYPGLLGWFLVDLGINIVGWAISAPLKTDRFYDMFGSMSFITLALGSLFVPGPAQPRKIFLSGAVLVWTGRLGIFLALRIWAVGADSRFNDIKKGPLKFLVAWLVQSLWVWITILPVLLINMQEDTDDMGLPDIAGGVVFACGFLLETVADFQKFSFKRDPSNKGKFIRHGLWSLSRHPNYVGEMMVWWGVFGVCATAFAQSQPECFASVVSPLFVMGLLCFGSGVPLLEKQADVRWGGQPDYEAYKRKTPVLVPMPWHCCRSQETQERSHAVATHGPGAGGVTDVETAPSVESDDSKRVALISSHET